MGLNDKTKVLFFRLESWNISRLQTGAMATGWKWSCLTTVSRAFLSSGASRPRIPSRMNIMIKIYLPLGSLLWLYTNQLMGLVFLSLTPVWSQLGQRGHSAHAKSDTEGRWAAAAHSHPWRVTLFNCYSCLSHPITTLHLADIEVDIWDTTRPRCNICFFSKVLFIADAKIGFDSFRNCMTATVNSKTIITVNPGEMSQPQNKIRAE